jgi:Caspase domain
MRTAFPAGLIVAAAVLLAGTLSCTSARADKRVALVIGNSAYQRVPRLANPVRDALAMADVFKAAGFQIVDVRQDLDANGMRRALRDFSLVARDADTAVVFFAGHGIELDGTNYLLPIDAKLEWDLDVEDEAMALDRVLKMVEQARRLRLVILDACRDNPFLGPMKRSVATRSVGRGLAKVETTMPDTLVAFAARAGSTATDGAGEHSPFTGALLRHLAVPGLDVRFAFGRVRDEVRKATDYRQEPSIYGSLGGDAISIVPGPPEASRQGVPNPDELTWEFLAESNDIAALKRFIERFPDSRFRARAEARIAALSAAGLQGPAGPAADEIAWNMVRNSKDAAQLRRFVAQFPDSPRRADAERQIAALEAKDEVRRPPPPAPPKNDGSRCLVFNGRQICQ